jgi:hypothetical protein
LKAPWYVGEFVVSNVLIYLVSPNGTVSEQVETVLLFEEFQGDDDERKPS